MNLETLIKWIHRQKGERSWTEFATDLDVPISQLHMAANGKRKPQPALLRALGIEKVVDYRKSAGK